MIFIEVALTRGISAHGAAAARPRVARWRSGARRLRDVLLDHQLPGRAARHLVRQPADQAGRRGAGREFPHLRRFATLSPVARIPALAAAVARRPRARLLQARRTWLRTWPRSPTSAPLSRLCARYLLHAKQDDEPLDPVARFTWERRPLDRLNWMGDTSDRAWRERAGLMVNYVYWLGGERNHVRYFREHVVVAAPSVEKLARGLLAAAEKGKPLDRETSRKRDALRPRAARRGTARRPRPGDRLRARARDGGHNRIPAAARRLLLDHVGGAAFAPRAAPDLRPGLPRLLARPEAGRTDDAAHAAAGLRARPRKPEQQQSQRLTDALFSQKRQEKQSPKRSSSRRGLPSPRARCCSAWTSTPCRRRSSPQAKKLIAELRLPLPMVRTRRLAAAPRGHTHRSAKDLREAARRRRR